MKKSDVYKNNLYFTHISRVVDADTFEAQIDLGCDTSVAKKKLRLARVNAPERYTDDGKAVTEIVRNMLEAVDYEVVVQLNGRGKYNRWIAEVYIDSVNLSDFLVKNRLAVVYEY